MTRLYLIVFEPAYSSIAIANGMVQGMERIPTQI